MTKKFENLNDEQVTKLLSRNLSVSDNEVNDWFKSKEDDVKFKVFVKKNESTDSIPDVDLNMPESELEKYENGTLEDEATLQKISELQAEQEDYEEYSISLIHPNDFDYEPELDDEDNKSAASIDEELSKFEPYFKEDLLNIDETEASSEAESMGLPLIIDHRRMQSSVKNQARRGTCVAHASCGVLEAYNHIPDDLSEQYLHYKFNDFLGRAQNKDQGLKTTDAAKYLARNDGKICEESEWPYIPNQATINAMVSAGTYTPPSDAVSNQDYGIKYYKIITDKGLTGDSIRNTRYLEALIYQGYNIVIGTWVAWQDSNNDGILEPRFNNGQPIKRGGHAMVVVGYNKRDNYFIVKNSWNSTWGHAGYAYLSYDYVRTYFKYGFIVKEPVPYTTKYVPRKLVRAPYSSSKISRYALRTAIVAFKTSRGRFAVCEAYGGYNLHLKNLVVYNPNGTIHLRKENLIVRGTYLCDLDRGRETSYDADFWWEAVRPGVNYLVPRNGAKVCILYNLDRLKAANINRIQINDSGVASRLLNFAVIVGKTTTNRPYKAIMHMNPGNKLEISYLEVYNNNGTRYKYKKNIFVPSSWTYNFDTLQKGGGKYADIWWHVVSDNVGFVEKHSTATIELLYCV